MQEDHQPNETRIQCKGDHRVPKVRSEVNPGYPLYRQPRPSYPQFLRTKKPWEKKERGSNLGQRFPPPSQRGSDPARDKSATNRRPATNNISKALTPTADSYPQPSLPSGTSCMLKLNTGAQNSSDSQQPATRGQGCDGHRHRTGTTSLSRSTGHMSHHPEFAGTDIPHRVRHHSRLKLQVMHSRTASPIHQKIIPQPSADLVKHETPELQPTPTVLPQATHKERSIRQHPYDSINLTLDSSDAEFLDTPDEEPPAKSFKNRPSVAANSVALPLLPSERTSNELSRHGFSTGSVILGSALNLVKEPYDKPRLFVRYTLDFETCLANISARGFIDQICTLPQWEREIIRSPENSTSDSINGACVLNAYGSALLVLAHGRENNSITIHRLGHRSPTRPIGSYNRPAVSGKPEGLTAICSMMQPLSFATGGADHAIHIWNVDHNLQIVYSESPLAVKHTSKIYSLLPIWDSSQKLVSSGADYNVNVYDLPSERVINIIKLSNPGFHIHHSGSLSTLLIQTAHREHQFEIRDLRTRATNGTQTFGFASDSLRLSRFARGDVAHSTLFACGDLEGRVHIWDLRNVKQPAAQVKCFQTEIKNVIWHESHILASSDENHVAAIPYTYSNSVTHII
ncbi:WD40 repeat-like protein [Thelephora ganbajun]|uniref:WD40 repeat-like protein n=1 Tax=Thelephora ganbajun TaxID=370292 RepID=A0ACB6ZIZ2_THEGA|nr:WD40 repeat-like protein [Thelephora ganbajun]